MDSKKPKEEDKEKKAERGERERRENPTKSPIASKKKSKTPTSKKVKKGKKEKSKTKTKKKKEKSKPSRKPVRIVKIDIPDKKENDNDKEKTKSKTKSKTKTKTKTKSKTKAKSKTKTKTRKSKSKSKLTSKKQIGVKITKLLNNKVGENKKDKTRSKKKKLLHGKAELDENNKEEYPEKKRTTGPKTPVSSKSKKTVKTSVNKSLPIPKTLKEPKVEQTKLTSGLESPKSAPTPTEPGSPVATGLQSPTTKSEPTPLIINKITVSYPTPKKVCKIPRKLVKQPCAPGKRPLKVVYYKQVPKKPPPIQPVFLLPDDKPQKPSPENADYVPQSPTADDYDEKYPTFRPQELAGLQERTAEVTEHTYGNVEAVEDENEWENLGYDSPISDHEKEELEKATDKLLAIIGSGRDKSKKSMHSADGITADHISSNTLGSAQGVLEETVSNSARTNADKMRKGHSGKK